LKKVFIIFLFLSFCSSDSIESSRSSIEPSTTSTSITSTTTSSTTTSTTLVFPGEEILASELKVGDCFNGNGSGGYYLESAEKIEKVPCDYPHEFEIVTSINYLSNTETDFNEEGVPNLEIYTQCEVSYLERFGRDIGGTSTYLTWTGNTTDFSQEEEYLCFVAVFDYIEGPQNISTEYEQYLYAKTKNFESKKISELEEGECFWKRRPDVDLFYDTEVDVLPCNETHSHELLKKYDFPTDQNLITETEYFVWAYSTCYDLGGIMRPIVFFIDEFEDYGVRTYSMFDSTAFATGEQTQAYCISHLHYGFEPTSNVWHKNVSFTDIYQDWIVDNDIDFESSENSSVVRLSCPTQNEIDEDAYIAGFLFTVVTEHRPIKNVTFSYIDDGEEYFIDFTEAYALHGFDELSVSIIVKEAFYFYMLSNRTVEKIMDLDEGTTFMESAKLSVTDTLDNVLSSSCEF
jgi:hypothetical protein